MSLDKLDKVVERGMLNLNVGLENGMKKINRYINRTQTGRYYLIGGESGVGKTTYTDFILLEGMTYALDNNIPIAVKYYSFEMSAEMKMASWICYIAWKKFGKILTSDYITGRIKGKPLSDEDYQVYLQSKEELKRYLAHIHLHDSPLTPTGIFHDMVLHYENPERGVVHRAKPKDPTKKGRITGFTPAPEWENGYTIGVIDHVALGIPETGQDTKRMIDAISRNAVITRNLFDTTWFVIQQFNTEMSATQRISSKGRAESAIAPQRLDFGDSKYTYRDADAVLGLVSPRQFDLKEFFGFDVQRLGDFLIVPHLMKNRYGPDRKILPAFINPLTRTISDLPDFPEHPATEEWYKEAQELKQLCQSFFPTE